MYKYDEACEILSTYAHVCDSYFAGLSDEDICLELQRKFCEVEYNKYRQKYCLKYSNLLCDCLRKWDLAEEIKQELFDNPKYRDVVRCYKLFRKA